MANRKMIKVPIKSEKLITLIKTSTSIRKLGPTIGYSEKTIRRGLKDGELSVPIVFALADELGVDPDEFADFDIYRKLLRTK